MRNDVTFSFKPRGVYVAQMPQYGRILNSLPLINSASIASHLAHSFLVHLITEKDRKLGKREKLEKNSGYVSTVGLPRYSVTVISG